MDGFSSIADTLSDNHCDKESSSTKFASYGAVHLNNTDIQKATNFWTKIVGMKLRKSSKLEAEFGTENQTLVVVHKAAKSPFKKGYSGLYHIAIHAPNIAEFASMLNRLVVNKYRFSPVDHTMSKSIYLDDPDGINIEFTLETPERFKSVITDNGLKMEDTDGTIRNVSASLDVKEVLKHLKDKNPAKVIAKETYVGHIHLYANNVQKSFEFYKTLGFIPFNNLPQFMYADLGAGGPYKHRVALNSWHGVNKPMAPADNAGLRCFNIIFNSKEKLNQALEGLAKYRKKEDGYWTYDPTGNKILLSNS